MSLNNLLIVLVVLITGIFLAETESLAGKPGKCSPWPECKDDGGDPPPPPPPPPTGCTDKFPAFLYEVEATRKAPAELHLSSTDQCRTELVATLPKLGQHSFHMTADGSEGVIVWSEDHDNQYIVRRLDFAVDALGALTVEEPVKILPLVGEEADAGDYLFYFSSDIWGDATHDSLLLALSRGRGINSGPDAGAGTDESMIYDLNDLTGDLSASPDVRVLFSRQNGAGGSVLEFGTWPDAGDPEDLPDCFSVTYPQFVPTCYRASGIRFNPSGTRLYFERNLTREFTSDPYQWHGVQRIRIIDKAPGADFVGWTLSGPELVYTGGPNGVRPRPDGDPLVLPSPEIVTAGGQLINADDCAASYAPANIANGTTGLPADFWQACIDQDLLAHGNAKSWESPDSYLFDRLSQQGRGRYDIYRVYVSGGVANTEALLIETARNADTGQ